MHNLWCGGSWHDFMHFKSHPDGKGYLIGYNAGGRQTFFLRELDYFDKNLCDTELLLLFFNTDSLLIFLEINVTLFTSIIVQCKHIHRVYIYRLH